MVMGMAVVGAILHSTVIVMDNDTERNGVKITQSKLPPPEHFAIWNPPF